MSSFKKNNTSCSQLILLELEASVDYLWSSRHNISEQLQKNDDKKSCERCSKLLTGSHYSICLLCLGKSLKPCCLCNDCYNGRKFEHRHPLDYFFNQHSLVLTFEEISKSSEKLEKQKGMEDLSKIAKSYYQAGSSEAQDSAQRFFKSLDKDGDGRVDLSELLDYMRPDVHSRLRNPQFFRELDRDNSGTLDFYEAITLFYITKSGRPFCDYCGVFVAGMYYSCVECFKNPKSPFNLCCACYKSSKCNHNHGGDQRAQFMDNYMLLKDSNTKLASGFNQNEEKMDELSEIAKSYYRSGSSDVQASAQEFFKSMDTDGDGHVNLPEFLGFLKREGHSARMRNPHFFKELDRDNNGTLGFWEVVTLYYIIKSGRPFCDYCGNFIPGIYFSCAECFIENPESPFTICRDCCVSAKSIHNHNGQTRFLDNYSLLEANINKSPEQSAGASQNAARSGRTSINITVNNTTTYVVNHIQGPSSPEPSSSTAVVPDSAKMSNKDIIMGAIEVIRIGVNVASIAASFCSIL